MGIYSPEVQVATSESNLSGIKYEKNGSWSWQSSSSNTQVLILYFSIKKGLSQQIKVSITQQDKINQLDLSSESSNHIYTTGDKLKSIQSFATFNIDNFNGELFLIHHFQDSLNYDYLSVQKNQITLGRVTGGITKNLSSESISISNWNSISVVGDGRHFRGYLNDELILHAHQSPLNSGKTGFGFIGKGILSIRELKVLSLN